MLFDIHMVVTSASISFMKTNRPVSKRNHGKWESGYKIKDNLKNLKELTYDFSSTLIQNNYSNFQTLSLKVPAKAVTQQAV